MYHDRSLYVQSSIEPLRLSLSLSLCVFVESSIFTAHLDLALVLRLTDSAERCFHSSSCPDPLDSLSQAHIVCFKLVETHADQDCSQS